MCSVRISEQTVTFPLYIVNRLLFIIEMESDYCAVRTGSLRITDTSRLRIITTAKTQEQRMTELRYLDVDRNIT